MATCASCRAEVAETDFFCWSCGKPWKGGAAHGTFEEQVYDEYAQRMREEYVRDRAVRAATLAVLAVLAAATAGWALAAAPRYASFYAVLFGAVAVAAGVRAVVNRRQHRAAKARRADERPGP